MAYSKNHAFSTAMAALRILEILKETDKDHPITQVQIADMIGYDRKAVARTLNIMERELPDLELVRCRDGVYYEKSGSDFDLYEIRMLCDSILSSKIVSARETKTLLEKLGKLVSERERKKIPHITTCNARIKTDHQQTMLNVDLLNEAIIKKCQVAFDYMAYGRDKKLHKIDSYQVSPYQLIFSGGFYLLLATVGEDETLRPFRIDLMKMTDDSILENVPVVKENSYGQREAETTLYVEGHPYMQVGVLEEIRAEIKEDAIGRAIDAFGKNIRIDDGENEGELCIAFQANTEDAYLWALQNSDAVTVLSPQSLRDRLRVVSDNMNGNYLSTIRDWKQANIDAVTDLVRPGASKRFSRTAINIEDDFAVNTLIIKNQCHYVSKIDMYTYTDEIAKRLEYFALNRNLIIHGRSSDDDGEMKKLPKVLEHMPRLSRFECWRDELTDVSVLHSCDELQEVELHCKSLKSADALSELDELNNLDIADTSVKNIDFILKLPALRELRIGDSVDSIEPLYSATQIKRLYVSDGVEKKLDMDRLYEANPGIRVI